MEGYLFKWTNFIKGYQIRYFIIIKHILYYSKQKGDSENKAIPLKISKVIPEKEKSKCFIIESGSSKFHLKANSTEDRDIWVEAISNEIAILNLSQMEKKNSQNHEKKNQNIVKQPILMKDENFNFSKTCHIQKSKFMGEENPNYLILSNLDEITKQIQGFQSIYFQFSEGLENINLAFMKNKNKDELKKLFSELGSIRKNFKGYIDNGYKAAIHLKELINKSKIQINVSENSTGKNNDTLVTRNGSELFYEANESFTNVIRSNSNDETRTEVKVSSFKVQQKMIEDDASKIIYNSDEDNSSSFEECLDNDLQVRKKSKVYKSQENFERALSTVLDDFYDFRYIEKRENLPFPIKVSNTMLADMLKSITKDKIELPIHYNEPLSMMQKLCERFQYANLIFKASQEQNKHIQLAYIAGFILGEVSLNINRILKPFNPILGETYEFYDNDLKYRYFSEQVSHHPPISAYISESEDFVVYGDSRCKNKFKMFKAAMELIFSNRTHVFFKKTNDHLSYSRPIMYLKGLIMGKPRYDYAGEITINNHNSEDYLNMEFFEEGKKNCPNGYVEGKIFNKNKEVMYYLKGSWQSSLYLIEIKDKNEKDSISIDFNYCTKNAIKLNAIIDDNNSNPNIIIYEIWSIKEDDYLKIFDENNYKLSKYACNLNNLNDDLKDMLPQTDSRLRPDQRALENQDMELAEKEKKRIEEKQRSRHKIFEENKIKYEPKYFNEILDNLTNENVYLYRGDYWKDRQNNKFEDVYQIFLN